MFSQAAARVQAVTRLLISVRHTSQNEDIPPVDKEAITFSDEGQIGFRDYNLCGYLGAGHFGEVHAGIHKETSERYAIKILQLEKQLQLEDVIALEQEIRAIKVGVCVGRGVGG